MFKFSKNNPLKSSIEETKTADRKDIGAYVKSCRMTRAGLNGISTDCV